MKLLSRRIYVIIPLNVRRNMRKFAIFCKFDFSKHEKYVRVYGAVDLRTVIPSEKSPNVPGMSTTGSPPVSPETISAFGFQVTAHLHLLTFYRKYSEISLVIYTALKLRGCHNKFSIGSCYKIRTTLWLILSSSSST
jgi:hypothetical protein